MNFYGQKFLSKTILLFNPATGQIGQTRLLHNYQNNCLKSVLDPNERGFEKIYRYLT